MEGLTTTITEKPTDVTVSSTEDQQKSLKTWNLAGWLSSHFVTDAVIKGTVQRKTNLPMLSQTASD